MLDYVYRMSFLCESNRPVEGDGGDGDGGDADGGGGGGGDGGDDVDGGEGANGHEGDDAAADDGGDFDEGPDGDDNGGDGGAAGGSGRVRKRPTDSEAVRLLRQYLASTLEVYSVISVPATVSDGEKELRFYQVLDLVTKKLFIKTFTSHDDLAEEAGLFNIVVQPFERSIEF